MGLLYSNLSSIAQNHFIFPPGTCFSFDFELTCKACQRSVHAGTMVSGSIWLGLEPHPHLLPHCPPQIDSIGKPGELTDSAMPPGQLLLGYSYQVYWKADPFYKSQEQTVSRQHSDLQCAIFTFTIYEIYKDCLKGIYLPHLFIIIYFNKYYNSFY